MTRGLALVFVLSGATGLVYQVAWQRVLTTYYGVGAVSTTLVVSLFLFGLGVGGALGGRLADRVRHPLRAYVALELALGAFGAASPRLLGALGSATAGSPYALTAACMLAFLLLPTALMGATLPLLTKAVCGWSADFLGAVGRLYFANTLGAAGGSLAASYVGISFLGLDGALYAAAATNVGLAVAAGAIARAAGRAPAGPAAGTAATAGPVHAGHLGRAAHALVFLTGFLAIGYEIAWFRLNGVLLKSSPYAFSTVLAVYLLGIALGSFGVERWAARRPRDLRTAFFATQAGVGLYVLVSCTAYRWLTDATPLGTLTRASFGRALHPDPVPLDASSLGALARGLYAWLDVLFWPSAFLLVPAALMGAGFPLASALALRRAGREGRTVGGVYAANVAGNVAGGIAAGFLLLPRLGTGGTLLAFALVELAFLAFARGLAPRVRVAAALAGLALAAAFPRGDALYRVMHTPPVRPGTPTAELAGLETRIDEGVDTVVASFHRGPFLRLYVGGLEHGGRPGPVFHYEALAAAASVPRAREVLVVGFGTGAIAETLLHLAELDSLVLVEISAVLLAHLERLPEIAAVLADPRLERVVDDGRRYLQRTERRFDLILTDPLRTTTAYSNNLYSREYLALLRDHLAQGGAVMMWMDETAIVPRTIATVFEHVSLWPFPDGESAFCVASREPHRLDVERLERLASELPPEMAGWVRGLAGGAFPAVLGRDAILERTTGWPTNTDRAPHAEYYLGRRRTR